MTQQSKLQCLTGLCSILLAISQEVEVHKTFYAHATQTSFSDLYNYLAGFKKKIFGNFNMNLGEFHDYDWSIEHCALPPESKPDEPFVVK